MLVTISPSLAQVGYQGNPRVAQSLPASCTPPLARRGSAGPARGRRRGSPLRHDDGGGAGAHRRRPRRGLAIVAAGTRFLRAVPVGVDPLDPASLAAGVALLVAAALAASQGPAALAARVDPVTVLREQ